MYTANIVIIGGGVVGCAIARRVSERWENIFVLEQMPRVGMGASSRNSGVIHSGLYYTPGTLKARHCVRGNHLTYEFCAAHNVLHRRTGKLIVARTLEEESRLAELLERGRANGGGGPRGSCRRGHPCARAVRRRPPSTGRTFDRHRLERRAGQSLCAARDRAGGTHRHSRTRHRTRAPEGFHPYSNRGG